MNVIQTKIPGLFIIEPRVFGDHRGYFFESWSQKDFADSVADVAFCQDNESMSRYGVLRGLHFQQPPHAQSKLVRCLQGEVLDVAVDIRKGSPTYGQWESVLLSQDNHRQLFLPRGMAHGFAVLSEEAIFQYKCDNFYHPESEGAIAWNDPDLAIDWQIASENAILSAKDLEHPCLKDIDSPFVFEGLFHMHYENSCYRWCGLHWLPRC